MHGVVMAELEAFANEAFGAEGFRTLLVDAGLGARVYAAHMTYPDEEVMALVEAASRRLGTGPREVLEFFGRFMAPHLLATYPSLVDPTWGTLDVLEHTEAAIHRVVRLRKPGATPPHLTVRRVGPGHAELTYASSRGLCTLARGIVQGLAAHFHEAIDIEEAACMHRGAPECLIHVRATAARVAS
ncbi:MAG: heme NO-binding domain-containing protein [Myxococcota bacterium]